MTVRVHIAMVQITSRSNVEVDRIRHRDNRPKGLNLPRNTVNLVTLREERSPPVVPHVGSVCFIKFSF